MRILGVKIGGSVLTRPGLAFSPDLGNITQIARALAQVRQPMVLVHGMGTYGRAVMPLYDGAHIDSRQWHLARRVLGVMHELTELFIGQLWEAGLAPSPLDPGTLLAVKDRRVHAVATEVLRAHLTEGRVPVLHGGTFLEVSGRYSIVTSDQMLSAVGAALPVERAVWATDVDGVYAAGPDGRRGAPIPVLRASVDEGRIWRPIIDGATVIGDMHEKLQYAFELAGAGVPSLIVNGTEKSALARALAGDGPVGTQVSA